jgi:hypothetical protein
VIQEPIESSAVRAVHGAPRTMHTRMSWWRWLALCVAGIAHRRSARPAPQETGTPEAANPSEVPVPQVAPVWRSRQVADPAN